MSQSGRLRGPAGVQRERQDNVGLKTRQQRVCQNDPMPRFVMGLTAAMTDVCRLLRQSRSVWAGSVDLGMSLVVYQTQVSWLVRSRDSLVGCIGTLNLERPRTGVESPQRALHAGSWRCRSTH